MREILYEDNHLIVALKPAGVLSQSDNTNNEDMLTILKSYIKEKYNKSGNVFLGLVHRLDKDVSGIMVFARTSKAASRLSEQIRIGQFDKRYYAVCEGILKNKEGLMEDYIERKEYSSVVSKKGVGALSKLTYKVLKEKDNQTLLDIHLLTGRHHQIRVQLSSRHHPLLGDKRYGNTDAFKIALFSYSLSFYHPITKELLTFKKEVPKYGYFKPFAN